jgi:hypothetical protein
MRIASDIAALQSARLPPNAVNAIAAILGSRPVVLARATYGTVPATKAGTFLRYTFPANALMPGDQLVLRLYGTVQNASAFVDTFFVEIDVLQDSAFQILSAVHAAIDHTTTNPVSWCLDSALAFSIPQVNGQTFLSSSATAAPAAEKLPRSALAVGGYMALTVTNSADFSATLTGGQPVSTATTGSYQISTLNADNQTFSNNRPTAVSVSITNGSFNTFSVLGGYLLGL